MAIRNFYVEVNIDGRKHTLKGGPQGKMGGMTIRVYQRDQGKITQPIAIDCMASSGGTLETSVYKETDDLREKLVFTHNTIR